MPGKTTAIIISPLLAALLVLSSCSDDDSSGAFCGNDVLEDGESCDGADLNGATCSSEGFSGGTLSCSSTCELDTTGCTSCGNGAIDGSEDCDTDELGGATCEGEGFVGGDLACNSNCTFDTSGCYGQQCGNGAIEGNEVCDDTNLNGESCISYGFNYGDLACAADCLSFDETGCYDQLCGDGAVDGTEACDGDNLGGATCVSLGHFGGDLACAANCLSFNETGCYGSVCGNGTVEGAELCDGTDLNGQTCATQGFDYGPLACNSCTAFDTSGCANSGTGQSCADFVYISSLPFTVSGADFSADYTSDHVFGGTDCGTAYGMEAVFAIELLAGEQIQLSETGGLDAVLRVLDNCDDTGTCLLSSDTPETVFFAAPADGQYFIVLEAYVASGGTNRDYAFSVEQVLPEAGNCGDAVDNDLDGDIDCSDPDCFGDLTHCATEALCDDGLDNDNDGVTDCADTDCQSLPACGGGTQLFFEDFSTWPPAGWTIEDAGESTNDTWEQCPGLTSPCAYSKFANGNGAGASGAFAIVNSEEYGQYGFQLIEGLVTPSIDCSGYTQVALHFDHYFKQYLTAVDDRGVVEVSTDGGTTYTQAAMYNTSISGLDGEHVALDISALAAGHANVTIRFWYNDEDVWAYYWMIDSIDVRAQ